MKRRLTEIQQKIDNPNVQRALDAVADVKLTLNNSAAIVAAADRVGTAANAFAKQADGNKLTAVDPWLPSPSQYK